MFRQPGSSRPRSIPVPWQTSPVGLGHPGTVGEEPHQHPPPSLTLGHPLRRGNSVELRPYLVMGTSPAPIAWTRPTSPTLAGARAPPSKGDDQLCSPKAMVSDLLLPHRFTFYALRTTRFALPEYLLDTPFGKAFRKDWILCPRNHILLVGRWFTLNESPPAGSTHDGARITSTYRASGQG